MARIKEQPKSRMQLGMSTLMWCLLAKRLLTVKELQHALAVKVRDTVWDEDDIPTETTFLNACLGLVVVDEETTTVRLVHYSLQEYLQKHQEHYFPCGDSILSGICLTYLSLKELDVHVYSSSLHEMTRLADKFTLLMYIASTWADHMRGYRNTQDIKEQLYQLVRSTLCCKAPKAWLQILRWLHNPSWKHLGRSEELEAYLDLIKFGKPLTALHAAAAHSSREIMEYLLQRLDSEGLEVINNEDEYGMTPLFYAAVYKNEGIVQLLINRADVDRNIRSMDGVAPLGVEVESQYKYITRLFLEKMRQEDPAPKTTPPGPLLYTASSLGDIRMVRQLLDRGAKPNNGTMRKSADGTDTYMAWAALQGAIASTHPDVLQVLLQCDGVDINAVADDRDDGNNTPLLLALSCNPLLPIECPNFSAFFECLQLLVGQKNIDLNLTNKQGYTPLMLVAAYFNSGSYVYGTYEILEVLLGCNDIDLTLMSHSGDTALDIMRQARRYDMKPAVVAYLDRCERLLVGAQRRHYLIAGEPQRKRRGLIE